MIRALRRGTTACLLILCVVWPAAVTAHDDTHLTFRFKVRDWPVEGLAAAEAQLIYRWRRLGARGRGIKTAPVNDGGNITFPHVPRGMSYTLWFTLPDDRYVLSTDVEESEEVLEVGIEHGQAATVRVVGPEGVDLKDCTLSATRLGLGGVRVQGERGEDGTWRLHGLPPGRWQVIASCPTPTGALRGLVVVTAGSEATLLLQR